MLVNFILMTCWNGITEAVVNSLFKDEVEEKMKSFILMSQELYPGREFWIEQEIVDDSILKGEIAAELDENWCVKWASEHFSARVLSVLKFAAIYNFNFDQVLEACQAYGVDLIDATAELGEYGDPIIRLEIADDWDFITLEIRKDPRTLTWDPSEKNPF